MYLSIAKGVLKSNHVVFLSCYSYHVTHLGPVTCECHGTGALNHVLACGVFDANVFMKICQLIMNGSLRNKNH